MKRIFMIICLLFSISSPNSVMAWNFPADLPFLGLEKLSADIKRSVFAVQMEGNLNNNITNDDYINLGTGFLVLKDNVVVGITCDHVIKKAIKNKKNILIGLNTEEGYQRFIGKPVHRDPEKDIAIILPQKSSLSQNVKLTNLTLKTEYLAKETDIVEGRGTIIPGYPLGLGLQYDENHPVIKFGIVAQFTGRNIFLIDGISNPGNSGSPVFDLRESKFIGMIQSYKPDFINLFDDEGRLSAQLPYNSGLSNAISAEEISKKIEKLNLRSK